MPRYKVPYTLLKHPTKAGIVWYYRLADDPKRTPHSTGIRGTDVNRKYAVEFVERLLAKRARAAAAASGPAGTLWEYLDRYFVWETCPHVARLLAEKKTISRRYVDNRDGRDSIPTVPADHDRRLAPRGEGAADGGGEHKACLIKKYQVGAYLLGFFFTSGKRSSIHS